MSSFTYSLSHSVLTNLLTKSSCVTMTSRLNLGRLNQREFYHNEGVLCFCVRIVKMKNQLKNENLALKGGLGKTDFGIEMFGFY